MNEITRLLSAAGDGDPHAAERLLPLIYGELRALAAQRLAQRNPAKRLRRLRLSMKPMRGWWTETRPSTGPAGAIFLRPLPSRCAVSWSTRPAARRRSNTAEGRAVKS